MRPTSVNQLVKITLIWSEPGGLTVVSSLGDALRATTVQWRSPFSGSSSSCPSQAPCVFLLPPHVPKPQGNSKLSLVGECLFLMGPKGVECFSMEIQASASIVEDLGKAGVSSVLLSAM